MPNTISIRPNPIYEEEQESPCLCSLELQFVLSRVTHYFLREFFVIWVSFSMGFDRCLALYQDFSCIRHPKMATPTVSSTVLRYPQKFPKMHSHSQYLQNTSITPKNTE